MTRLRKSRRQRGFTLVELMVVVCIIGVLSSIAAVSFTKYIKKGKTAEAREFVRKIYEGARSYYMDPAVGGTSISGSSSTASFPRPSAPATPGLGACCVGGGKCAASALYWDTETWNALHFSVDDPHYFAADNLEKAYEGIPDDAVSLLLSHSPEIYRHAAYVGFDFMMCGHTHGGQICLPGSIPLSLNSSAPRFTGAGSWNFDLMQGYTSVGTGSSVVPARFNCPPEITLHTLSTAPGPAD